MEIRLLVKNFMIEDLKIYTILISHQQSSSKWPKEPPLKNQNLNVLFSIYRNRGGNGCKEFAIWGQHVRFDPGQVDNRRSSLWRQRLHEHRPHVKSIRAPIITLRNANAFWKSMARIWRYLTAHPRTESFIINDLISNLLCRRSKLRLRARTLKTRYKLYLMR